MDFDEKIRLASAQIETARARMNYKNPIYLSVDEWGTFQRNFMGVLPVAECLNSFVRHADVVKMANFTLATSLLSNDPQKGTFKTPLFYTFKLFSINCQGTSVDTYVTCDTFNTELYRGISYLDATTVFSKDNNTVCINVINKSKDKAITTDIVNISGDFSGKAEATVVKSDDLRSTFTFDKQSDYVPVTKEIKFNSNKLSFTFPPHSFTQIILTVARK
jgi:alpha-N-arabinofuranosidase